MNIKRNKILEIETSEIYKIMKNVSMGNITKSLNLPNSNDDFYYDDEIKEIKSTAVSENIRTYNVINDGESFVPILLNRAVDDRLPSGYYNVNYSQQLGVYFTRRIVESDGIIELPNPIFGKIQKDMSNFWTKKHLYDKYNMIHKRGILLYGPPGNGKSALLSLLASDLIKNHDGIILNFPGIDLIKEALDALRKIEPDRKMYVFVEDIDGHVNINRKRETTEFLNVLDGVNQKGGVVWLATTNYPQELPPSLVNRPSRFDRKYEITIPTPEERIFFMRYKMDESDHHIIDDAKEYWIDKTEGMSLADIKELIISHFIMEVPVDEVVKILKTQNPFGPKEIKGLRNDKDYCNDNEEHDDVYPIIGNEPGGIGIGFRPRH